MKVRVDPEQVKKRTADNRGRVRIGTEHAGKTVEVVVLDVQDDGDNDR